MQNRINIKAIVSTALVAVLAILLPVSCTILEDLEPCPRGLRIKFVYDYNMEYANAFHSKVDCYNLYVYDKEGNFLKSFTETGEKLKDENYRLEIDLPHGEYNLVCYGGLACDKKSFTLESEPTDGSVMSDLSATLKHEGAVSDQLLNNFYWGSKNVKVTGELYNDVTLNLMRNTNNVRIMLQHLDGTAIPAAEFEYTITDDNTKFDSKNNLVPNGTITYRPWSQGIAKPQLDTKADEEGPSANYAEFSTSRFYIHNQNRLVIKSKENENPTVDIPLNEYLLMLKSMQFENMSSQEFLDRQSDWSLIFFLDQRYRWINTHIFVNGWVVRLNDMGLV